MPGTSAGVQKSWITRKGGAPQQATGSNQASRPTGGVAGKNSLLADTQQVSAIRSEIRTMGVDSPVVANVVNELGTPGAITSFHQSNIGSFEAGINPKKVSIDQPVLFKDGTSSRGRVGVEFLAVRHSSIGITGGVEMRGRVKRSNGRTAIVRSQNGGPWTES